jgi:hypothetical protein
MKPLLGRLKYLLVLPILLASGLIISHAQEQTSTKSGHVELSIKIHPTIKLSPNDEKELNEKLAKFDKSLYRLVVLTNGRVDGQRSTGSLEISKELKAEMETAQKKGLSDFGPQFVPCQGVAFRAQKAGEARELIEAITPILSKYQ